MIRVELFEDDFDGGVSHGEYSFPTMPRIGEEVSLGLPFRSKILAVHYHFKRGAEENPMVRIAVSQIKTT